MSGERAVVFANGEYTKAQSIRAGVSNKDFLVCVDGGLSHCLSEGLEPDLLLGDFDSVEQSSISSVEKYNPERLQFPSQKNASDLELALDVLQQRSYSEVVVLGASGARSDHHLFNWQLFGSRKWPFQLRIVDDYVDAYVVHANAAFDQQLPMNQVFSAVPVSGCAKGVDVIGAHYPLSGATLVPGDTLGLSNLVNESRLQVNVVSGILLLMLVHRET